MKRMFSTASQFYQPIGGWNTTAVTSVGDMCGGASQFNQSTAGWNIEAFTSMECMFLVHVQPARPRMGRSARRVEDRHAQRPSRRWMACSVEPRSSTNPSAVGIQRPSRRWMTCRVEPHSSTRPSAIAMQRPSRGGAGGSEKLICLDEVAEPCAALCHPHSKFWYVEVVNLLPRKAVAVAVYDIL